MVTKAIERAQNTVEQRNAEIRKNVLKYDEVMNEQRKVIYKRRDQILDGADLRARRSEYLAEAVAPPIGTYCVADVHRGVGPRRASSPSCRRYWPTALTAEQLDDVPRHRRRSHELVMAEATAHYERREEELDARADARGRAPGDAAHHRPALARAPLRDGLPAGGHQPAGHGPEGPARRVAARGLRDVRPDDEGHRPGLRALRHARPGRAQEPAPAPVVQNVRDALVRRRRPPPALRSVQPAAAWPRASSTRGGRGGAERPRRRGGRRPRRPCSRPS